MTKILVVDDRASNRQILSQLVKSLYENVDVRAFDDPRPALEWTAEYVPDLVVTDYKMKSMTGADFIHRLRRQPSCKDVPVIVITAYQDIAFRYRSLEEGATDFLLSPIDHHEFRARAHNLLTLRENHKVRLNAQAAEISNALAQQRRLLASLRESEGRLRSIPDIALDAEAVGVIARLLRQPADAMSLLVEALRRDARGPGERTRILQEMDSCIGQFEGRVRSFLDLVWAQQGLNDARRDGQSSVAETEFRIMPLLRKLEIEAEPIARRSQARLRVVGLDMVVRTDRWIVEAILRNLLADALIFGKGSKVLMGCRLDGQRLEVFVRDENSDTPAQRVAHVFDVSEKLFNAIGDPFEGLGLGLFIAQRLASRLGQNLHFCPRGQRGSVISLSLAIARG